MTDPKPTLESVVTALNAINEKLARLPVIEQNLAQQQQAIERLEHQRFNDGGRGRNPPPGGIEDRPPRYHKLDFPKFDGKSDPLLFINKCESFFQQQRTLEEEKVWLASFHLEGVAQQWYMHLQQEEGTPRWCRFTELLNIRFGPPIRANPLGELAACRRER